MDNRKFFDGLEEDENYFSDWHKSKEDFENIRKKEQEKWEREFYEKLRGNKKKSTWRVILLIVAGILLYLLL